MSVPTARLESLHLTGGMPPHTRSMSGASASPEVSERAIIVRDILASFQADCLPSEYKPEVFRLILDRPNIPADPPTPHVTQGDLEISLFRLGSYDIQVFRALRKLQEDRTLALLYRQRLSGKFERLFEAYDNLPPTSASTDPSDGLTAIVAELRSYEIDAKEDRLQRLARSPKDDQRRRIDQGIAAIFIRQIGRVCDRSSVRMVQRRQRTPRQPASEQPSYLFQQTLGDASDEGGHFGLEILEACSPEDLEGLQPLQDAFPGLRRLRELLEENGASDTYRQRFAALVTEEEEEE